MLAVIRLRGELGLHPDVKKTLNMLKLDRQFTLALVEDTPDFRGMIKRAQDYVMWGEVNDKLLKQLSKKLKVHGDQIKYFHMHPPRGGFKAINKQQPHGDLGKAKDIQKWIDKMMPVQSK